MLSFWGEDFGEVKWGMSILEHPRTAFSRQIKEACLIQKETEHHNILNSRAEWNQCALPRLTTSLGDQEMKYWEKEIIEERDRVSELCLQSTRKCTIVQYTTL